MKCFEISADIDHELGIDASISKSIALERTTNPTKLKPKDYQIGQKNMKKIAKIANTAIKKTSIGSNFQFEAKSIDPKTKFTDPKTKSHSQGNVE